MKTIEYRVTYSGARTGHVPGQHVFLAAGDDALSTETVHVQARDINSGFVKALKIAREPLGNGHTLEIASIEFWAVV